MTDFPLHQKSFYMSCHAQKWHPHLWNTFSTLKNWRVIVSLVNFFPMKFHHLIKRKLINFIGSYIHNSFLSLKNYCMYLCKHLPFKQKYGSCSIEMKKSNRFNTQATKNSYRALLIFSVFIFFFNRSVYLRFQCQWRSEYKEAVSRNGRGRKKWAFLSLYCLESKSVCCL